MQYYDVTKYMALCVKKGEDFMKKFISVFLAITVIFSFAAFAIGSSDDDSATVSQGENATNTDSTTTNGNVTVNVGDVLKTSNLEITYNECGDYKGYSQYFAPKNGFKYIYIDLGAKNIGESDAYISVYEFKCYADDVAMEAHYEEDDISATLSSGRSTSGRVYFEVPVDAKNIEIEYETDFWDDQKAVFIVK